MRSTSFRYRIPCRAKLALEMRLRGNPKVEPMQTNILWSGRAYYSLENCVLTTTKAGLEAHSVIIGKYNHEIYRVDYIIKTNAHWEIQFFELKTQLSDKREVLTYHSDGKGNWTKDGSPIHEFKGCMDIDISLTPFTNSLPINRLQLSINENQQIKVLYLDILNHQIKPVHQRYTRLSQIAYKYENVPNDFEAIITIDESGLIVDYPELFERTDKRESH